MPYSSISELPSEVRGRYTSKQLRAFRSAFNAALDQGKSEEQAFRIAHRAAQGAGDRDAPANAKAAKRQKSAEELGREAAERYRLQTSVQATAAPRPVEPDTPPSSTPPPEINGQTPVQRAFLVETNEKTVLTAPVLPTLDELERAWTPNPAFMYLAGKYVGADEPNRNGALWTTADLEMGEPTVRNGPLNWLHEDRKIVGAIAEAKLVQPKVELAALSRPYIATAAVFWRFLWPDEARVAEMASEAGRLWQSMECVSREVSCIDHGCGSWPYLDALRATAGVCEHVGRKTGTRRFVDPIFTGGACIVPPVRPGWPGARTELMRQAAQYAEKAYEQAGQPDVPAVEWEKLMASVLEYAGAA